MRNRYVVAVFIFAIITVWVIIANMQVYKHPDQHEIRQKVNYLSRMVNTPFAENLDMIRLKEQNPEWLLFSLSFTTFAMTNIAFRDTNFKAEAVSIIDKAIQKAVSDTIYKYYFQDRYPFYPVIDTTGSVLYFGHLNMILGCYRLLTGDGKYNDLNDRISASLNKRFSESGCLESYPGKIWIADNTVALASLKIHSDVTGSEYKNACDEWETLAKAKYTSRKTGLLCSTVDPVNALPIEETRGSGIGWSILFIYRFDTTYARELYKNYTAKFSTNLGLIRIYKEKFRNYGTGTGDIDSGPVLFGCSIPANAFAFGDAVAMNDFRKAKQLERLISLGRNTIIRNNEISYQTRWVDMPVSPLAEALFLYFETMTKWELKR